jgi:hypothetical protein
MILDADYAEVGEPIVTVRMTKRQAEWAQHGLSDIACWSRGFIAALKESESDRAPIGLTEVRELNIALKRAIEAAE